MARQEANNVFALTSLLYGANAAYIEDLYASYKTDPNSVDPEWRDFFAAFQDEKDAVLKEARGAPWKRKDWPLEASGDLVNAFDGNWAPIEQKLETKLKQKADTTGAPMSDAEVHQATRDSVRALMMIRAYRMRGHLHADLDPLQLATFLDKVLGLDFATIPEMLEILKRTYCSTLGVEFMHISDPAQKVLDSGAHRGSGQGHCLHREGKKAILNKLIEAEGFEKFLRRQIHRHQALRPGWRRVAGSGAGTDHQARRPAGRQRHRARHGPPRPPQRAGPT
jgi:2-oxoglutarate dehydrogenase E1 component